MSNTNKIHNSSGNHVPSPPPPPSSEPSSPSTLSSNKRESLVQNVESASKLLLPSHNKSSSNHGENPPKELEFPYNIQVGSIVEVARRMWPGINRPGGAGRVTFVHYDDDDDDSNNKDKPKRPSHVNVVYIIEHGRESRIPMEYIQASKELNALISTSNSSKEQPQQPQQPQQQQQQHQHQQQPKNTNTSNIVRAQTLRNRSMLLGRCKHCGSLRKDCGSCDLFLVSQPQTQMHQKQKQQQQKQKQQTHSYSKQSKQTLRKKQTNVPTFTQQNNHISSSSSEDTDDLIEKIQASRRKLRRHRRRKESLFHSLSKTASASASASAYPTQTDDGSPQLQLQLHSHSQPRRKRILQISSSSSSSSSNAEQDSSSENDYLPLSHLRSKQTQTSHSNHRPLDPLQSLRPIPSFATHNAFQFSSSPSSESNDNDDNNDVDSDEDDQSISTQPEYSQNSSNDVDVTNKPFEWNLEEEKEEEPNAVKQNHLSSLEQQRQQALVEQQQRKLRRRRRRERQRRRAQMKQQRTRAQTASPSSPPTPLPPPHSLSKKSRQKLKEYLDPLDNPEDTFIQPEGEFAAENLPQGMNDRTLNTKYQDLPQVFDDMADAMEKESIPDAHYQWFMMKERLRREGNENEHEQAQSLEKQYLTMYQELRNTLIRNGLDQCRYCLKRIQEDYSKHKKHLTRYEKQQVRGISMETRDFRLEQLTQTVEDILKPIRDVLKSSSNALPRRDGVEEGEEDDDEMKEEYDNEDDEDDESENDDREEEEGGETSFLSNELDHHSEEHNIDLDHDGVKESSLPHPPYKPHPYAIKVRIRDPLDDASSLPSFDPHQHATRVRTKTSFSSSSHHKQSHSHGNKNGENSKKRKRNRSIHTRKEAHHGNKSNNHYEGSHTARKDYHSEGKKKGSKHSKRRKQKKDSVINANNDDIQSEIIEINDDQIMSGDDSTSSNSDAPNDLFDMSAAAATTTSSFRTPTEENETSSNIHELRSKSSRPKRSKQTIATSGDRHVSPFLKESRWNKEHAIPKTSAKTSMEQFLRANSVNDSLDVDNNPMKDTTRSDPSTFREGGDRSQRSKPNTSSIPSHTSTTPSVVDPIESTLISQNNPPQTSFPSMDELYESLESNLSNPTNQINESGMESRLPPVKSISELCDTILEHYPTNPKLCMESLHWIHDYFQHVSKDSDDVDLLKRQAKTVFGMILKILQTHGSFTLLEGILYIPPSYFVLHTKLLTTTFLLMDCKLNQHLSPESEQIYKLFKAPARQFKEEIFLQVLDVLYSQILPNAWAHQTRNVSKNMLDCLESLSSAISATTPIIETVSCLILTRFKCQQWRKYKQNGSDLNAEEEYYISSIDPDLYRTFLICENENSVSSQELAKENERFKMFKTAIPRSEIEAVWSILGYFGRMKSPSSDVGHRWRLFISLFLSQAGVLGEKAIASSDKTISPLPPCNEHLTSCATEIKYLSLLLKSRNLDPLPPNDTIFEKLFMKSVGLQADSLQYDNNARESFLNNYHEKSEMRTIRNLWESSDLINLESLILTDRSYTPQDMIQRLFYELSDIRTGEEILYQGPSSIMIRSCVSLCLAWELGCTKKARKIRCNKVVSELVNRLVTEAKSFEQKADLTFEFDRSKTPNSCVDDFARSFSASANVKQNVDPGSLAVANFYRETAAFLLLSSTAVKATSDFVTMSNHFTDPKFHQKIWKVISTNEMEKIRECYYNEAPIDSSQQSCNGLFIPLLLSAAKIISFTLEVYLDQKRASLEKSPVSQSANTSDNSQVCIMKYLISCMSTCLKCSCVLLKEAKKTNSAFIKNYDCYVQPSAILCARVMTRICCLFCKMLDSIQTMIQPQDIQQLILSLPRQFATYILSLITSTLSECMYVLLDVNDLGSIGDSCFRSQLTLIRMSVSLSHFLAREESNVKMCNAQSQKDDDPFGSIDDDIFLNIDIDSLVSNNTNQRGGGNNTLSKESLHQTTSSTVENGTANTIDFASKADFEKKIDEVIGGEIWALLIRAMNISSPSLRYSIADNNHMNSIDAKLCGRQLGGICACLGAMCTLRKASSVNFVETFETIFRPGRQSQIDVNDRLHLKMLGQSFSAELCHYAKSFKNCKILVQENLNKVFGHFLESLIDSSIIDRFPTSNLILVEDTGGQSSMCQEILEKVSRLAGNSSDFSFIFNDNDARGVTRRKNAFFDAPEHNLCKSLWMFSANLGRQMSEFSEDHLDSELIKNIGKVLLNSDYEIKDREQIVPIISNIHVSSLERECFKRLMKLRGIFRIVTEYRDKNMSSKSSSQSKSIATTEENVSLIIKSLLEQLYFISDTVKYYNRISGGISMGSRETYANSHKRSRAYALQKAYTEMAVASLSYFLRFYKFGNNLLLDGYVRFVRDFVICPVLLKEKDFDLHVVMREAATPAINKNIPQIPFDIDLHMQSSRSSTTSPKSMLESSLNVDLQQSLSGRMGDLTAHLAYNEEKGLIYTALMEAGIHSSRNQYDDFMAMSIGYALQSMELNNKSSYFNDLNRHMRCDELQKAVDNYFNIVRNAGLNDNQIDHNIGMLRSFVLHKYFLPRLQSTKTGISSSTKVGILLVFIGMFENKHIKEKNQVNLITLNDSTLEIGSTHMTHFTLNEICSISRSLMQCIRNELRMDMIENRIIEYCFSASKFLLEFSIDLSPLSKQSPLNNNQQESNNIISVSEWIDSSPLRDEDRELMVESRRSYLKIFSQWMFQLGEIITNDHFASVIIIVKRLYKHGAASWDDRDIDQEMCILRGTSKNSASVLISFLDLSREALNAEKNLFPQKPHLVVQNKYSKTGTEGSNEKFGTDLNNLSEKSIVLNSKAKLAAARFVYRIASTALNSDGT